MPIRMGDSLQRLRSVFISHVSFIRVPINHLKRGHGLN
jgi:hypothetical protein